MGGGLTPHVSPVTERSIALSWARTTTGGPEGPPVVSRGLGGRYYQLPPALQPPVPTVVQVRLVLPSAKRSILNTFPVGSDFSETV